MRQEPDAPDASRFRFAIVASGFNHEITERLVAGARAELERAGAAGVDVHWVPGAFELPLACQALAKTKRFDALVALGCVIRGETPHFEYVATEAARGIMAVMLATGLPVAFGVLTADDRAQADARAGGPQGNKGADAARAASEMAALLASASRAGR